MFDEESGGHQEDYADQLVQGLGPRGLCSISPGVEYSFSVQVTMKNKLRLPTVRCESWRTAAIPLDHPCRSCKLTRVRRHWLDGPADLPALERGRGRAVGQGGCWLPRARLDVRAVSSIGPNQPQVLHTSTAKFADNTCFNAREAVDGAVAAVLSGEDLLVDLGAGPHNMGYPPKTWP